MPEEVAAPPLPAPAASASSAFVCGCDEWMRSACDGEPFYREHEGKRYCVLHFPGAEKGAAFAEALKRKLDAEDFDFKGVWFPDGPDFSIYFGAAANFSSATFGAAANFSSAKFSAAADFSSAIFKDYVRFAGGEGKSGFSDQSSLTLEHADIEKPERVSFHTLALRPHWFINADARKFHFTNVKWPDLERHGLMQRDGIKQVIEKTETSKGSSSYILLTEACRRLAVNAEENHRYEEAAQFRYWAMDVRRRERWRGLAFWKLSWWYWRASGYGERILRALVVLLVVWMAFALLYTRVGFTARVPRYGGESDEMVARRAEVGEPLDWSRATTYSLGVLTLQKPEPRPVTIWAQRLVLLETLLGPLQAALLALAIRRKFMR